MRERLVEEHAGYSACYCKNFAVLAIRLKRTAAALLISVRAPWGPQWRIAEISRASIVGARLVACCRNLTGKEKPVEPACDDGDHHSS
ncbi:hypothetical protein GUJ93_ZPchr0010g10444 [Zizania palustris]|uniref:Uncharacterized protein n=1 Tax=Zizania palustris TaxID=103762 RepID=A0A8J5VT40_ZIZPA|nr:hypothetical protein GUJ93_ZPchr0010g10444 [Zizania palustris]